MAHLSLKFSFKTTPDGKLVYFPWSSFGPGYEVQTEAQHQAIRRYNRVSTTVGIPLFIATYLAWKFDLDLVWRLLGLVLVAAHFAHFAWQVRRWQGELPRSNLQMSHKEVREARLATLPSAFLWFFVGLTGLIAAGGVALIVTGAAVAGGIFFFLLFGGFAGLFAWGLAIQRRLRLAPPRGERP